MTSNLDLAERLRVMARGYSTESGRDALLSAARIVEQVETTAPPRVALLERIACLATELCVSVDKAAEDIGGERPALEILRDIGPLTDQLEKLGPEPAAGVGVTDLAGSSYEAVGWQYKFPSLWGGHVWRDSASRYNGSDYSESREIFAKRSPCARCGGAGTICDPETWMGGPCPDCSAVKTGEES